MLKHAKRASLALLKGAGVFRIFANSRWRSRRLVILCYHGISLADEHRWDPTLFMSPRDFAARLDILAARRYNVLPLGEAVKRLYARDLPPRSVAITFDDGNYDFYRQAWPLLKERGLPVTVYQTTFYCGYSRPVFNVGARYLLWKAGRAREWQPLWERSEREHWDAARKDEELAALAAAAGVDYEAMCRSRILCLMNQAEIAELHAAGVDFQLHTHRHRTPPDRELFLREIRDNRSELRSYTGARAAHFCYPSGVTRPEFLPWLEEAGVASATTCVPALANARSNPLLLPRFVDHPSLSAVEFESCLSGFGLLLPNEGQVRRTAATPLY
jgi:peptidoglycan/xylan/chitin deacetylase (PgdA/CDA1 family)